MNFHRFLKFSALSLFHNFPWIRVLQFLLLILLTGLMPGMGLARMARAAPASTVLTYTVNSTIDEPNASMNSTECSSTPSGLCTLRAAIMAANANPGEDIIHIPASNYTLTILNISGDEDMAQTGDLDVTDSVIIQGAGASSTIIQAGTDMDHGIDKVFALNPKCAHDINVSLDGVTIRYGNNTNTPVSSYVDYYGGGGLNWCGVFTGNFNFSNSIVADNQTFFGPGGGLSIRFVQIGNRAANLTHVTFQNNTIQNCLDGASNGGALEITGNVPNVTISDSQFIGNSTTCLGGAIFINTAHNVQIHNSIIDGNHSGLRGGGMYVNISSADSVVRIDQGSQITNNISGPVIIHASSAGQGQASRVQHKLSGGRETLVTEPLDHDGGSGIFIGGNVLSNTPVLLSKVTVTGNFKDSSSQDVGGGILVGMANVRVEYSRIASNRIPGTSSSSGLFKDMSAGAVTAINNWWGCSTGPGAYPCDPAAIASGSSGSLVYEPYLRLSTTPAVTPLHTNQVTKIYADFHTNSAGADVSADIQTLLGLHLLWYATSGILSDSQDIIGPDGSASTSFQATYANPGVSVAAKVDNDSVSSGPNVVMIPVEKADTTVTIASQSKNPTVTGEPFTVYDNVAGAYGNSPVLVDGTVTINAGAYHCTDGAVNQYCTLTLMSAGNYTMNATYSGDSNYNSSSTKSGTAHTVNKAATTATITNAIPNPSVVGQPVTVSYAVAVKAPGSGTPGGTVTVSDGVDSCTATLPSASCNIVLTTAGSRSLTATYNGDSNYNPSPESSPVLHTVLVTDLTIDKIHTGDFTQGQTGAAFRLSVSNTGSYPSSGAITVEEALPQELSATAIGGYGWSCTLSSLTCTRSDELPAGYSFADIVITVDVAADAPGNLTNLATVSGGGDANPGNNTASDTVTVHLSPDTLLLSGPENPTRSSSATFTFSGLNGTGALNFECNLNGGGFESCLSPQTYSGLQTGTYTFQVRAVDTVGVKDATPASYTWQVQARIIILSPGSIPDAKVSVFYEQTISASGGTAPYSFHLVSGTLPPGLSLASNGVLSGAPTEAGTYTLTIQAIDSSTGSGPYSGTQNYTIQVSKLKRVALPFVLQMRIETEYP